MAERRNINGNLYLAGQKKRNASIVLEWKVPTDEEQATITLERKAIGGQFVSLKDFATSIFQSQQPFAFTDLAPVAGLNLCQLKVAERNGRIRYSHTLAFELYPPDEIHVYPNPVVSTTTIRIPSQSAADAIKSFIWCLNLSFISYEFGQYYRRREKFCEVATFLFPSVLLEIYNSV